MSLNIGSMKINVPVPINAASYCLSSNGFMGHGGLVVFAGAGFVVFNSNGGRFVAGALERTEGNNGGGLVLANSG